MFDSEGAASLELSLSRKLPEASGLVWELLGGREDWAGPLRFGGMDMCWPGNVLVGLLGESLQ